MISYYKTETRTCDVCQVRQTLDPESSLCVVCAEKIAQKFLNHRPRRVPHIWVSFKPPKKLTYWGIITDTFAILWHSIVPWGHCPVCGMRRADCGCEL